MRHLKTLGLMILVSALLASCGSTVLAIKPNLIDPSVVLTTACATVVELPEDGLTVSGVEIYWSLDRAALLDCGDRFEALVEWYKQRDTALGG